MNGAQGARGRHEVIGVLLTDLLKSRGGSGTAQPYGDGGERRFSDSDLHALTRAAALPKE